MPIESLPWEKGTAAVLAVMLLLIFFDVFYRKSPRWFRSVRRAIDQQTIVIGKRDDDMKNELRQLTEAMHSLEGKITEALAKRQLAAVRSRRRSRRKP